MIDNSKEYIFCAAWRRKEPRKVKGELYKPENNNILLIKIGYRHQDIYWRFEEELEISNDDMGFYTSKGRFVSHTEGMKIAYEASQMTE